MAEHDVPVAIAGGGLVGLSAAMFLAQHGVPSLAIERLRGGSPVPRAAAYGLSASGTVLVRPDGFVCWRTEALVDDPRGLLLAALRFTLGR